MIAEKAKGHMATFGSAVLFGLMSPISKLAMGQGVVDGLTLATLRVSGAAALFWLASLVLRDKQRIDWKQDWVALIGMSMCGMAVNQFFYIVGVQNTAPTNACVIGTSVPVMALILSALFLHQRITWAKGLGVGVACAGALVLVLGSVSGDEMTGSVAGDAMVFVSQMFAAFYFVFFGRVIRKYGMVTLMKWLFTISTALTLPMFAPHMASLPWHELGWVDVLGCLYTVVVGTFVCYILLIAGQKRLTPSVVATYNYVQPVVAAVLGVCWGLEAVTWEKCLAVTLIALGVWKVTHNTA